MVAQNRQTPNLLDHRNRTVARSFYRQLRAEGFTHQQVIELSAALLDLVTEDMSRPSGNPTSA